MTPQVGPLPSASHAPDASRAPDRSRASRSLWVLFVLCIGAVTHGSLYPWRFRMPADPYASLRYLLVDQPLAWTGLPDVAGNVLMFMPVGALGVLLAGRHPHVRGREVVATLLPGLAFAFALQVLQVFVPGRYASLSDVASNAFGLVIGVLLSLIYRRLPHPLRSDERAPAAPLAFALVLLWLLALWWPLVPRFDWQQLRDALSAVLIQPHWDEAGVVDFGLALGVAVCGSLLRGMGRPFHALAGLVVLALLGRAFVVGHTLNVAQVSGALIGLAVAPALQRLPRHWAARALALAVAAWLARIAWRIVGPHAAAPVPSIGAWLMIAFWLGALAVLVLHSRSVAARPMR